MNSEAMEELEHIIEQLCPNIDVLKTQIRQIGKALLEVTCYTYSNYFLKLNEHKLAAVYTLYLTYSRDMLRDMAMTVLTMMNSLSLWVDLFLIISAAHMLHMVERHREETLVETEIYRPSRQVRVNLSDYMKIVNVHKELILKLTNCAETYDLILSSMALAIGHMLLLTYLCSYTGNEDFDVYDHVRRVVDYAMTEESKKVLSDYYSSVTCEVCR